VASDDLLGWAARERFPAPEPCRAPPFPPNPGRCHILGAATTRTLPHPNPGRCHILGASATRTLPHPGSATSQTLPHPRRVHILFILTTAKFRKRPSHTPDWQAWWMHSCGLGCPPRSGPREPAPNLQLRARDLSTRTPEKYCSFVIILKRDRKVYYKTTTNRGKR